MRTKHYKREGKHYIGKMMVSLIVVSVIIVSSFVTVMANTIPCTVIDGEKEYTFSLLSPEQKDIVAKAVEEGMNPLQKDDQIFMDSKKGQVIVKRALTVSVNIGNEYAALVAYHGDTVASVLQKGGILLHEGDLVEPAPQTTITSDTLVRLTRCTAATVTADGKTIRAELYGGTVADALKKLQIKLEKGDQVIPSADTLLTNDMAIRVNRARNVVITEGNESKTQQTMAATVGDALKEFGISLAKEDKLNVKLTDSVVDGMKIAIERRSSKEVTERESISYETTYRDDRSLARGETAIETAGQEGEKEVLYEEIYVDGELSEKVMKSEKILREPVTEVILQGTKEQEKPVPDNSGSGGSTPPPSNSTGEVTGSTFTDGDGKVVSYQNVMVGECTAYSVPGGTTSLGEPCRVGVVAVDPDVIPYGTRLYVTSGSYVYGYCVAGDTGGAAMAGDILVDVYYDTYEECCNFGRRDMTVYILS
ncbi:MAG: ubiquitin-like domain-containing protein [Oscillospiraceae bacterium]